MKRNRTRKLVIVALLTAIVVVLQLMAVAIRFGTFSVSLVLIPIVVGAAVAGPLAGAWLGLVFSLIVLANDSSAFMAISPLGTILTVLIKGTAAGFMAGLVFRMIEDKNRYLAVITSAIICPLVNTGIFIVGCYIFFIGALRQWAVGFGFGDDVTKYIFLGLVGANFLFEVLLNMILSPVILRIIDYTDRNEK